jgi:hypothetical protein
MKFSPKTLVIGAVVLVVAGAVAVQFTTDIDLLKYFQKEDAPVEEQNPDDEQPEQETLRPGVACKGEALVVDYTYPHPTEEFDNPWECQVQCDDGVQRYISYENGTATQCESLPGCLDLGEDQAVTCIPPVQDQDEEDAE